MCWERESWKECGHGNAMSLSCTFKLKKDVAIAKIRAGADGKGCEQELLEQEPKRAYCGRWWEGR